MATALEKEIGNANVGVAPWAVYGDLEERVPKLAWPNSILVYDEMRNDAQLAALLLALTLPILRYRWFIDPNGASDEAVEHVATDLGLPIKGADPDRKPRTRDRFDHGLHLRQALLDLTYGHMFFEQVYRYDEAGRKLHIRKLAPRMPGSISEIEVADDGGLLYIRQSAGRLQRLGSGLVPVGAMAPVIPVDRLVAYVNEKEGSNWRGRSLLRPCYKPWLLKDELVRVDSVKHKRNGMGVPVVETEANATPAQIREAQKMASAWRAGDFSGAATPPGMHMRLVGTEGSLPDTLASIKYHDEQMARRFLAMFMQLGSTETGSRALGESFVDFFSLAQESIATDYMKVTNEHVVEDLIDLNYGIDESAPLLDFVVEDNKKLAIEDLVRLIDAGVITTDPELEDYVRTEYELPEKTEAAEDGSSDVPVGEPSAPGNRARLKAKTAPKAAMTVGGRTLRRNPTAVEVQASTDWEAMEQAWQDAKEALVAQWLADVKSAQVEALTQAIEEADSLAALAAIEAPVLGESLLVDAMTALAETAGDEAIAEAAAQSVTIEPLDMDELAADISARAAAQSTVMARSIGQAASQKAITEAGTGVAMTEVAERVGTYLTELSDSYLHDQLGGVMTQAQNTARREVFGKTEGGRYYASELLDTNTCTNCKGVDNKEYDSLEAATLDYPSGGFHSCLGGARCRGTLVWIAPSESEPSVQ